MSVRTMAKVWDHSRHSGSELLMLLAIADFADDDGRAFPSITTLAQKCRTTPRYAIKLLDALVASRELDVVKHGGVMGRGGKTNLYRVILSQLGPSGAKAVHPGSLVNSGAVVNPGTGSSEPWCREVVHPGSPKPSGNHQEPPIERKAVRKRTATLPCPSDVDQQIWSDWLTLRKAKKAPVTETVVNNARSEAAKAGMTMDAFLQVWCARGSQGLQADWLKPSEKTAGRTSFAQQDREAGMKRWEEMTGRVHPDRSKGGDVIDVEATPQNRRALRKPTSHHGLADKDYTQGISPDGSLI